MTADLQVLVRHIRRMASRDNYAAATDRFLLDRYVREHDEAAFATVVGRHAGLVAGVCGRVLGNTSDVEDAFQATFLLLARKAKTMQWRDSVANWLFGVAHRLALRARSDACRRQALHTHGAMVEPAHDRNAQLRAMQELLDEEMERLPEAERKALVHCYLEGHTRDEAARLCQWSLRTLDRHLNKGRDLLRQRLSRRGLELAGVMIAVAVGEQANAAGALTAKAIQFVRVHAGLGGAPFGAETGSAALSLANTGIPITGISYLKVAAAMILVVGTTALGLGAYLNNGNSSQSGPPAAEAKKTTQKEAPLLPPSRRDRFGDSLPQSALVRLGTMRFRNTLNQYLAFSPDSQLLYAAGQDCLEVLEVGTGKTIRKLGQELPWPCWSSAYSNDGKLVAITYATSGQSHNAAVVYELATGRKICSLQVPPNRWMELGCFSPDGKLIGVRGYDYGVDVYEAASGAHLRSFDWDPDGGGTMANYAHVAFMPDSKSVIGASAYTGTVRTFDLATGKESGRRMLNPNGIDGMISSPDGAKVAILVNRPRAANSSDFLGPNDGHVHLFDAVTWREIANLTTPDVSRYSLTFSPDSRILLAGNDDNRHRLMWDATTGKELGSLAVGRNRLWGPVVFSPSGKLAAAGDLSCVQISDRTTGLVGSGPAGHVGHVQAIELSPDGFQAATGGAAGKIILWNRATAEILHELDPGPQQVFSHVFSHDSRTLYSLTSARTAPKPLPGKNAVQNGLQAWNTSTGKAIWGSDALPPEAFTLALSPDGRILAVAGKDQVALFETAGGKPIRTLTADGETRSYMYASGPNTSLIFTKDGSELLAWGNSKGIHRWDLATGNHLVLGTDRVNQAATSSTAFSPDGKLLVLGAWCDHLLIVDVATGKEVGRIKGVSNDLAGAPLTIAFSPDGQTLAWGGPVDGKVRIVNPTTGATIRELIADSGRVNSLHFSADGKTLAAGYANSTALIWDLRETPVQN